MCFMEDKSVKNPYEPPNAHSKATDVGWPFQFHFCWFNFIFVAWCAYVVMKLDYDYFGYDFLYRPGFWIVLFVGMAVANLFFWFFFLFQKTVVRPIVDSNWSDWIFALPAICLGWIAIPQFVNIVAKYYFV